MHLRGTYNFEISDTGNIIYTSKNVELLRNLWLDSEIIKPGGLGPGDPGDFENGAWHVACHLVAAGCVYRTSEGKLVWLEISYDKNSEKYIPTMTFRERKKILTVPINYISINRYLENSELLGFVEGTSEGRISASNVIDDEKLFNGSLRQEYNKIPGDPTEGGRVWEHWCTTRDIRNTSPIGTSVLDSFITLIAAAGDKFIPIVARGRFDYEHPAQLRAMVRAGLTSFQSAQFQITPSEISYADNLLFQEGTPSSSLLAIEHLDWNYPMKYYMFSRSINKWSAEISLKIEL